MQHGHRATLRFRPFAAYLHVRAVLANSLLKDTVLRVHIHAPRLNSQTGPIHEPAKYRTSAGGNCN